jgi:hypothetical protein
VRFASFLSGGFTSTMAVINPPESKLAKRTSVQFTETLFFSLENIKKHLQKLGTIA